MTLFKTLLVLVVLLLCGLLCSGCQVGVDAAAFYPNSWKQGGDPTYSRLGAQGIQPMRPGEEGIRH